MRKISRVHVLVVLKRNAPGVVLVKYLTPVCKLLMHFWLAFDKFLIACDIPLLTIFF
jgi:hypothetical protein